MSRLVICEKPSVAADVANALTSPGIVFAREPWGYRSPSVLVAAAAGHLVAELPPDDYDPRYKEWSYADLPIIPDRFRYAARDARAGQRLKMIVDLLDDPGVTEIVNACDAGREGELIFKLILAEARSASAKPVQRAWFSSMTPAAITAAFEHLRPDAEMAGLEAAARARSEADWLVGMNATRAASLTLGGGRSPLPIGRVQTPTLALVVARDLEIDNFVARDYWKVRATFDVSHGSYQGWWSPGEGTDRFDVPELAAELVERVKKAGAGTVRSVEVVEEKQNPPKLFDLTDLQRQANGCWGMTATQTLAAAQACYEKHKVLSYPRTDSRYIPSDMASAVSGILQHLAGADESLAALVALIGEPPTARIVNDSKVTDHHALIPAAGTLDLTPLSDAERKIFDLVARRFIAALLDPRLSERTTILTDVPTAADGRPEASIEVFRTVGRREISPGWHVALPPTTDGHDPSAVTGDSDGDGTGDSDGDDAPLCRVDEGEPAVVSDVSRTAHRTKSPPRFNEASLLGVMATAGTLVEDDELAEAMKESGLGTPATRASIIDRLIAAGYLERATRKLLATAKGRGLILALDGADVASPALTGTWERRLRQLEQTPADAVPDLRRAFDDDVRQFTAAVVASFEGLSAEQMRAGLRTLGPCPLPTCAGEIVETPKAWACSSWRSPAEPGCGATLWKTVAGKRITETKARRWMADVAAGKVTVEPPRPRRVLGPCPSDGCAGEIVSRQRSWGCTSWRSSKEPGCGYVIWRTNPDGSEVTDEVAAALYAGRQTNARELTVLGKCPTDGCAGDIVERQRSWSCSSWQSPKDAGCGYVIWKSLRDGTDVTADDAARMLAAGESHRVERVVVAPCPRCSGSIVERDRSWSCDSWRSKRSPGCRTVVWKMQAGTEITQEEMREQLAALPPKPSRKRKRS